MCRRSDSYLKFYYPINVVFPNSQPLIASDVGKTLNSEHKI